MLLVGAMLIVLLGCEAEEEPVSAEGEPEPTEAASDADEDAGPDDAAADEGEEATEPPSDAVVWRAASAALGPVTASDELVTYMTEDDEGALAVVALDAVDGAQRWQAPVELEASVDYLRTLPRIQHRSDAGVVVTVADDGSGQEVVALDIEDGTPVWSFEVVELVREFVVEERYVATHWDSDGQTTRALELTTGEERWAVTDTQAVHVDDGVVVGVDFTEAAIVGLDLVDGEERWRLPVFTDEANEAGVVNYGLRERSGAVIFETLQGFRDEDDTLFYEGAHRVARLDPQTGEEVWGVSGALLVDHSPGSDVALLAEPEADEPQQTPVDFPGLERLLLVDIDDGEETVLEADEGLAGVWAQAADNPGAPYWRWPANEVLHDVAGGDGVWLLDDEGTPRGFDPETGGHLEPEGRILWSQRTVDAYVANDETLDIWRPTAIDDEGEPVDGDLVEVALERGLPPRVKEEAGEGLAILVAADGEVVAVDEAALDAAEDDD